MKNNGVQTRSKEKCWTAQTQTDGCCVRGYEEVGSSELVDGCQGQGDLGGKFFGKPRLILGCSTDYNDYGFLMIYISVVRNNNNKFLDRHYRQAIR
jgi:hypothetical protein